MLKTFASITLLICFSIQSISKLVIVLNYQINKDFISKNLCVNRDEPDSCCHGKCELKKQLDEDEKRQNDATTNKDKFEKEQLCQAWRSNFFNANVKADLIITSQTQKPLQFFNSVFHPPPVI
jgi:hypothetical protein